MLRKLGIVVLLLFAIPAGWLGSAFAYEWWNTYTHRFRLTIEVDTPNGLKSGSNVIEVSIRKKADWIPQTAGFAPSMKGEAVFVDLGQGGEIIALLALGSTASNVNIYDLAGQAFDHSFPDWYYEAPAWNGRAELDGELIPTLITFSDLNDPKTARVVQPHEFPQVFGEGVKFMRATVEMTRDSVTQKIEQQVPFLKPMRAAQRGKSVPSYPGKLNVLPPLFIRD